MTGGGRWPLSRAAHHILGPLALGLALWELETGWAFVSDIGMQDSTSVSADAMTELLAAGYLDLCQGEWGRYAVVTPLGSAEIAREAEATFEAAVAAIPSGLERYCP